MKKFEFYAAALEGGYTIDSTENLVKIIKMDRAQARSFKYLSYN